MHSEKYISLFARIGERERARQILNAPQYNLTSNYFIALGYLALGEIDNTFKAMPPLKITTFT